jgi:hypothetical protein
MDVLAAILVAVVVGAVFFRVFFWGRADFAECWRVWVAMGFFGFLRDTPRDDLVAYLKVQGYGVLCFVSGMVAYILLQRMSD